MSSRCGICAAPYRLALREWDAQQRRTRRATRGGTLRSLSFGLCSSSTTFHKYNSQGGRAVARVRPQMWGSAHKVGLTRAGQYVVWRGELFLDDYEVEVNPAG